MQGINFSAKAAAGACFGLLATGGLLWSKGIEFLSDCSGNIAKIAEHIEPNPTVTLRLFNVAMNGVHRGFYGVMSQAIKNHFTDGFYTHRTVSELNQLTDSALQDCFVGESLIKVGAFLITGAIAVAGFYALNKTVRIAADYLHGR